MKALFLLALLFAVPAEAVTQYWRVVGTVERNVDNTLPPTPASFSIVVAYEVNCFCGLVLSQDVFPQTDTVPWDIAVWDSAVSNYQATFSSEAGDTISVNGTFGYYDTVDADFNDIRGIYSVSVLPYNLLVAEAPVTTLTARIAPTAASYSAAIKVMKKVRKVKRRV